MKDVYQVLNNVTTNFDLYETIRMTEKEKEKQKAAFREKLNMQKKMGVVRQKRYWWSGAAATVAIILCSGTVLAYGTGFLREYFMEKADTEKESYYNYAFMDQEYTQEVKINSSYDSNLLDFQVLEAEKGESTISLAVLVSVEDEEKHEGNWGYNLNAMPLFLDAELGSVAMGLSFEEQGAEETSQLAENQVLQYWEYHFDRNSDLSKVSEIQFQIINPSVINWDSGEEEMLETHAYQQWTLTIPLQNTVELERTYAVNQELTVKNETIYLSEIVLTPSAISFYYENTKGNVELESLGENTASLLDADNIILQMEDGTQMPLNELMREDTDPATAVGDGYLDCFNLQVPMDQSKVTGIVLDGQIIELK